MRSSCTVFNRVAMANSTLLRSVAVKRHINPLLTRYRSTASAKTAIEKHDTTTVKVKSFDEVPGENLGFWPTVVQSIRFLRQLKKPWPLLAEAQQKYGPIWKQRFGALTVVNLTDPKDVEQVFRNEGKYPMRVPFDPWVEYRKYRGHANGLLLHEGADWHRHRTTLSKKMMRPKEVAMYNDSINEVVTDMLSKVQRVRQSNQIVPDIENIIFSWALESACTIILNKKLNLLDDKPHPEAQAFIKAVHDMFYSTLLLFFVPASVQRKWNTWIWKNHVKSWDTIFATAKKLIDEKMNEVIKKLPEDGDKEETDFMTYMVSQGTLDVEEIYGNATDLLAAAVDTTSNTFLWVLYNVAKHPEVQQILHQEVTRIVPRGEIPTNKHTSKMPYLKAILKESMRMCPTIINNSRILENDIVIRGYNIPAKTALLGSNWLMSRNPDLFDDPLEFKPERWLREGQEHVEGFRFLPFGFGPRMCIGRRLAELEIYLALARISQQYTIEATTDVEPMITTITQPDRPLNLKFINRN